MEQSIIGGAARGLERITFDPEIIAGQACIRRMRAPVSLVVNLVAHRVQATDILALGTGQEYPDLEPEDTGRRSSTLPG